MLQDADHTCTKQRGKKKNHISESWQSAQRYFPKTLPKHLDVFFCMHTHSSYPLKGHNLKNRPEAAAPAVRELDVGVVAQQEAGTRMLQRPRKAVPPVPDAVPSPLSGCLSGQ